MNMLHRLWKRFLDFIRKRPVPYTYEHVRDFPDIWKARTVYLLGKPDQEWLAGMICPCGCGQPIELLLLETEWPRWKLTRHEDNSLTLKPSIWRTAGCKSHFFLRKGNIEWCSSE
ncbi:DUF6527 family protein [Spirosoma migulaei]